MNLNICSCLGFQQDVAPRGRQGKVRVVKLLTLGHCARVVTVHRLHVSQQARRSGEWENLTQNCRSRGAGPLSHALTDCRAAALAALVPPPPMLAEGQAAAAATLVPLLPVQIDAAVATLAPLSPVLANRRPAESRTEPASASARRKTTGSRGTGTAAAHVRRPTHRRSRGTVAAAARVGFLCRPAHLTSVLWGVCKGLG